MNDEEHRKEQAQCLDGILSDTKRTRLKLAKEGEGLIKALAGFFQAVPAIKILPESTALRLMVSCLHARVLFQYEIKHTDQNSSCRITPYKLSPEHRWVPVGVPYNLDPQKIGEHNREEGDKMFLDTRPWEAITSAIQDEDFLCPDTPKTGRKTKSKTLHGKN